MLRPLLFHLLCALLLPWGASGETTIQKSPAPGWVIDQPVILPEPAPKDADGGLELLLIDQQKNLATATDFSHYARRYLTQGAVQESSRITVSFNPAYQTLSWHKLVLHHQGQATDLLPGQKIRVLSSEDGLDDNLYGGNLKALIELEGVEAGDVVEYAFSVQGDNPIFEGKFGEFIFTSSPVPLSQLRIRVLCPPDRPFAFQENFPRLSGPTEQTTDGLRDLRWQADHIPALRADTGTPSWDSPYAWLQISEYGSWREVADWAVKQFVFPDTLPARLDPVMQKIRAQPTDQAQIQAALEYVQDDIRYLSLSEGIHSHRPYPVEEVVRRGFGDCKDKVQLLCSMLRNLGFKAEPAMVETKYRRTIEKWLPTPLAFDHVVVRAERPNGQVYWLDPTMNHQRGALDDRFFPDYGKALLVRENSGEFVDVTPSGFQESRSDFAERYVIRSYAEDVDLNTTSTYRGGMADYIRSYLSTESRENFKKNLLNYYARLYPGVYSVAEPKIEDDETHNVVTVEEKYRIKDFWRPHPQKSELFYAEFYASALAGDFDAPTAPRRTGNLRLSHPHNTRQTLSFQFPDDSKFRPRSETISDPAFVYDYRVSQSGRTLTISHDYHSARDTVSPPQLEAYLGHLQDARNLLTYSVTIPKTVVEGGEVQARPNDLNWVFIFVAVVALLFSIAACVAIGFWRPKGPPPIYHRYYHSLGGWLILVGFGTIMRPVAHIVSFYDLTKFTRMDLWIKLTTPGYSSYHPLWGVGILGEVCLRIFLFVFSILLVVLFFQRRRTFPPLAIGYLIAVPIVTLFLEGAASALTAEPLNPANAIRTFVAAAIWVPYLCVSKRVKGTFTG